MVSASEPSKPGAKSRKVILWLAGLLLLVALPVGAFRVYQWRYEHARAVWKTAALQRLAGLSATNEDIGRELEELKAPAGRDEYRPWAGDQVALMTNGEYIIYAFWHG